MTLENSQALIPQLLHKNINLSGLAGHFFAVTFGVLLLVVLSQLAIPLPWTPVPLTGQTLGVLLISLWGGRRFAPVCFTVYLGLGAAGAPVFALGGAGFVLGPTTGYLLGMALASFLVGHLADLGWGKTFFKRFLAGLLGITLILGMGVWGLSFFIPNKMLLMTGLLPFLPGEIIKVFIVSAVGRPRV